MGRRPKADADVHLMVGDTAVTVATSTVQTINAKAFILALIERRVSPAIAGLYARTAARSIRAGRAMEPDLITNVAERTSVRAYWRWATESYARRVAPVRRKLQIDGIQVARLRCGSLVPPGPEKRVPRVVEQAQVRLDPQTRTSQFIPPRFDWVRCDSWTLHIPASDVPVHQDPCAECLMYELTAEQVEVVAAAFEDAWGHRDLAKMPPEALLFGPQPPDGTGHKNSRHVGTIVGLVSPDSPVRDALVPLRALVAEDRNSFMARASERHLSYLVLERSADSALFLRVLEALGIPDREPGTAPSNRPWPVPAPPLPVPPWMLEQPVQPAAPVLALVPPIESGPVPTALQDPPSAPASEWTGEWQKPDNGPPVPPEVAAQLSGSWWQKSSAEFEQQFSHLLPPKK